jgi:saccharopine dehydrogenase-like NADP-dependent oxidoreductase
MDKNIHIGIVGAGKIGTSIYKLLLGSGLNYRLSVADIIPYFGDVQVGQNDYVELDKTKAVVEGESIQFNDFVKDKTLIINALPYTQNINLYKACLKHNVPYFDLSEDDALDKWISSRNYITPIRTGLSFTMPHCGLAPGISTILAEHCANQLEEVQRIRIRVGALSRNATNKLRYHTSWSGEGLVNEYRGQCQVVEDKKYETEPALSGYETIMIDGKEYEAFSTSGGIGTYAKTLANSHRGVIRADYKTLRRVGHHNYVDFLINDLNLPEKILLDIFNSIPSTTDDEVIIYVSAGGYRYDDWKYCEKIFSKVFRPQQVYGRRFTAIELSTACGILAMVELFLAGQLPKEGYVKQEQVVWSQVATTKFGRFYREEF